MDLADLLDFDEEEPIEDRVVTALRALPYPAYLARLPYCFGELAAFYTLFMTVEGKALVGRIADVVQAAAAGDRAAALLVELSAYCGIDPGDDLDVGDSRDFEGAFLGCCTALLWEYAGHAAPYSASADLANAAAQAVDAEIPAENLRMLLRFLHHAES